MEEPIFFLKGVLIGFAMAMPIGPIGVMSIRKTLSEGHSRGLIIGLGASTTNLIYGGIAAFGLTFVSDAISSQRFWLSLAGGVLLLFLGLRTFRIKRKDPIVPFGNKGWMGSFISGFLPRPCQPRLRLCLCWCIHPLWSGTSHDKHFSLRSCSRAVHGVVPVVSGAGLHCHLLQKEAGLNRIPVGQSDCRHHHHAIRDCCLREPDLRCRLGTLAVSIIKLSGTFDNREDGYPGQNCMASDVWKNQTAFLLV